MIECLVMSYVPFNDIKKAVREKSASTILSLFFDSENHRVREGFRTESEIWDYKKDCPKLTKENENAWADLASEILGFYNCDGGLLFFGVKDDFSFCGATTVLDSKQVNDRLRKYLGDRIWVQYYRENIQVDQKYLGLAIVGPRGPLVAKFRSDAPEIEGVKLFARGDTAVRQGDSTLILRGQKAEDYVRSISLPTLGQTFSVDEPFFRILHPEYETFVQREALCAELIEALQSRRSTVCSLTGIGGVGKTALATWGVLEAYKRKLFPFVVSVTAKDRELTALGIQSLEANLTSFEELLDATCDVLGFPELKASPVQQREKEVRDLIKDSNGLLYVDNLETLDDVRIVQFLDSLPTGVRAITTSRRAKVRVSVQPVDVGPFAEIETVTYVHALSNQRGLL